MGKSAEGSFDAPQASHGREKVTSATFHLKWNAFLDKLVSTCRYCFILSSSPSHVSINMVRIIMTSSDEIFG